MGRLFIYILWFVLVVIDGIFNGRGYGRARRFYSSFGRIGYSYDWEMMRPESNPNSGLGAVIRCKLRRGRATKKCKNFYSKTKYIITVKNKNITIILDTKNKTLSCIDNTVKSRSASVIWQDQVDYLPDDKDNIFEQTFDNICFSFSENASYSGILKLLKDNFDEIQESSPPQKKQKQVVIDDEPIKIGSSLMLDINSATAEEIAKLPGINIVLAKRIVKYRDLKGVIKSKEELYKEFNIKEHFQKELNKSIILVDKHKLDKSYDQINKNILNNSTSNRKHYDDRGNGERIIDF